MLSSEACPPSQPVFAGIAIFLVAIGLVGNAVIILLILVLKECSKSITNWYILQLALADTLFLLMLPFTASSELSGGWTYGVGMCKLKEAILFINYYASIYFLVVMSFDRYLAVTKAFSSSNWVVTLRRPRAAGIITVFGWVASIAISSPLFIYSTVGGCNICAYQFPMTELENCILRYGDENRCHIMSENLELLSNDTTKDLFDYDPESNNSAIFDLGTEHYQYFVDLFEEYHPNVDPTFPDETNETSDFEELEKLIPKRNETICKHSPNQWYFNWLKINFSLFFCLPLFAMCCFYGMIIRAIVTTQAGTGRSEVQRYRHRVTLIVLSLVFLFLLSWLPWYTVQISLMYGINLHKEACGTLRYAVRLIAYLNSSLNPYFYGTLGGRFMERLRKARSKFGFVYTLSITSDTKRRARQSFNNSARHLNGLKEGAGNGRIYCADDVKMSMGQRTERTAV